MKNQHSKSFPNYVMLILGGKHIIAEQLLCNPK